MPNNITWDTADFLWNSNPYTWDEIKLVQELAGSGKSAKRRKEYYDRLDKGTQQKVIKLLCKIKGVDYKLIKSTNPDIKVSASDIQLLIDEVLNKPTVWVDSPDTDRFTTNYDGV
tara:strand:- start:282 stop:626 length:345 start_codon:yes stop_codon:yes gene_type:complete